MPRITPDDLRRAAAWLAAYEETPNDPDDHNQVAGVHAVAEWLEREAERREHESLARQVARASGAPVSAARAAIKTRAAP